MNPINPNYAIPNEQTQTKMDKIFELLCTKGILIPFKDTIKFDKIFERINSTMKISEAKYGILQDGEFLHKYKLFWGGHFINDFDIYNDYFQQAASYFLSMCEHNKRFLSMILDLEKLGLRLEKATYGSIVVRISQKCGLDEEEMKNFFEIPTRNIIGHDEWYYCDKNFAYLDDAGNEQQITLTDFVIKIRSITELSSAIATAWGNYAVDLEFKRAQERNW